MALTWEGELPDAEENKAVTAQGGRGGRGHQLDGGAHDEQGRKLKASITEIS